ncbi:MAG: exo-alpha-sialidase [Candidatus Hydrogenedentes bacterium]|nr:exo-alpha-sialidase [Candidatus Hydrogenedentota bacterium]
MNRMAAAMLLSAILSTLGAVPSQAAWQDHEVRLLNGPSPVSLPARMQIVSEPWNRVVAVPYIAYMPGRDRLLMLVGCDYPHHAELLFSGDRGATWSEPKAILLGEDGKPIDGLGTSLTFIQDGTALFLCGDQRWVTEDYGDTWRALSRVDPTSDGKPWYTWDPLWVDRAPDGLPERLIETGYTWKKKPEVEKDHQQGYIRFSTDLGKTWTPGNPVPEWKEVSEVVMLRAANGTLVAACRTDIPPSKAGEWIDHYEGLGISISSDNGQTWSPVGKLYDYGRHHPSLVLLPDGRILMTYVVRKGYIDTPEGLPQFGIEAILSADHGQTWDLDHRYILHAWKGNRTDENKWWTSSQATSTVLFPDGTLLTAFGTGYRAQAGANGGNPAPRDAGLIEWRLSDAPLDATQTITQAPVDSDARNVFDPGMVK